VAGTRPLRGERLIAIVVVMKEVPRPKGKKAPEKEKVIPAIATHHEARRDYFILESMEAGIVLVGCEVKSLREGKCTLSGSFARFEGDALFLYSLHIPPYLMGNRENPEPLRVRKLLLHKSQLVKLKSKMQEKGLAIIPLKLYFSHGLVKVELGIGKGKKHWDKRADIKKDTTKRDIDRAMKNRNRG